MAVAGPPTSGSEPEAWTSPTQVQVTHPPCPQMAQSSVSYIRVKCPGHQNWLRLGFLLSPRLFPLLPSAWQVIPAHPESAYFLPSTLRFCHALRPQTDLTWFPCTFRGFVLRLGYLSMPGELEIID